MKYFNCLTVVVYLLVIPNLLISQAFVETVASGFAVGNITQGPDGYFYLSDFVGNANNWGGNGTVIRRISPDFQDVSFFITGTSRPTGSSFDSKGNFYFCSNSQNRILKKSVMDGQVSTFANGFNSPVGLTFNDADESFVVNFFSGQIHRLDTLGNKTVLISDPLLSGSNGVTFDDNQEFLYSCNWYNGAVIRIDMEGQSEIVGYIPIGTSGTNPSNTGAGYIKYHNDFLFVTGLGTNKIYRMHLDGNVDVVAGTGAQGGVDGPIQQARFFEPNGLYVYPSGDSLLVGETILKRLRLVTGINSLLSSTVLEGSIDFRFGPNPARDFLEVNLNTPREVNLIELRDAKGQLLLQIQQPQESIRINIQTYPPGAYWLSFKNEKAIVTKKVFIQ